MLQILTLSTVLCTLAAANPPSDIPAEWWYPGLQRRGCSGNTTSRGETLAVHFTYETNDSFEQSAVWYAEKAGVEDFRERLVDYLQRSPDDADDAVGTITRVNIDEEMQSATTLIFSLKSRHKHVTIVASQKDSSEMVVVSLSESMDGTIVQFAKHQAVSRLKLADSLSP